MICGMYLLVSTIETFFLAHGFTIQDSIVEKKEFSWKIRGSCRRWLLGWNESKHHDKAEIWINT